MGFTIIFLFITCLKRNVNYNADWVPITTPDGWVLLPSVTSSSEISGVTQTSTSKPTEENSHNVTTSTSNDTSSITSSAEKTTMDYSSSVTSTESSNSTDVTELSANENDLENVVNMTDYTDGE